MRFRRTDLHETRNDLQAKTRTAMIELLNQQLADVIDLGLQALGGIALGTIQVVSQNSRFKAYPLGLVSGREHNSALSGALAKFGAEAREAIDTAGKAGDADTADLFTEISRGRDKLLWMVEAHLQAQD